MTARRRDWCRRWRSGRWSEVERPQVSTALGQGETAACYLPILGSGTCFRNSAAIFWVRSPSPTISKTCSSAFSRISAIFSGFSRPPFFQTPSPTADGDSAVLRFGTGIAFAYQSLLATTLRTSPTRVIVTEHFPHSPALDFTCRQVPSYDLNSSAYAGVIFAVERRIAALSNVRLKYKTTSPKNHTDTI